MRHASHSAGSLLLRFIGSIQSRWDLLSPSSEADEPTVLLPPPGLPPLRLGSPGYLAGKCRWELGVQFVGVHRVGRCWAERTLTPTQIRSDKTGGLSSDWAIWAFSLSSMDGGKPALAQPPSPSALPILSVSHRRPRLPLRAHTSLLGPGGLVTCLCPCLLEPVTSRPDRPAGSKGWP